MSNIVERLFNQIKEEAKTCEITYCDIYREELIELKIRMGFNVVTNNKISNTLFNFYIQDYNLFIKRLTEYVYTVINFYHLDNSENTIKKIIILLWSNITKEEMLNIDDYVRKYIDFYNDDIFKDKNGSKKIDNIGEMYYSFDSQSIKQETPLCFNSCFKDGDNIYYLPRISYGIKDGTCYIYAAQNKNKNEDNEYSILVKKLLNTLNRGVKKYRNVTPSALASLSLFISLLKEKEITNFEVVGNLPIRHQNRELVDNYKLQIESKTKDIVEVDRLRKIMSDNRFRIYDNTTNKFRNNFQRLSHHFKMILRSPENELSENLLLEVISLDTSNTLFRQIVENDNNYVIK